MSWYQIKNIDQYDSPALVVYKQRVQENIEKAIHMVGDVARLRPHVKTNKTAEVCQMMMDAGIYQFKCATIAEAEMLAMLYAKEVLLAHQPTLPKMHRLVALTKAYPATRFSCLIDDAANASLLSQVFGEAGLHIDVFIDLNTGMNRSGIALADALALFAHCLELPNITVIGLHGYDGHIRDTDLDTRKQNADAAYSQVDALANTIRNQFGKEMTIIAGGSPTFPVHAARQQIQCSPGTFVYWDWGYKHKMPDEPFEYAALVVTRVISILDAGRICVDLGHKAIAAEMPFPRVHFLNAPDAVAESQSEEHLVLQVPDSSQYKLGDVLYGVPVHICPTVALYEEALVCENQAITGSWQVVARKRKLTM